MISNRYQFPYINDYLYKKLQEWYITHNDGKCARTEHGAIGGEITFHITPTSIGSVIEVSCTCGSKTCLRGLT